MRCAKTLRVGKVRTQGVTMSPPWCFRFSEEKQTCTLLIEKEL
jgi:hypothetical protein